MENINLHLTKAWHLHHTLTNPTPINISQYDTPLGCVCVCVCVCVLCVKRQPSEEYCTVALGHLSTFLRSGGDTVSSGAPRLNIMLGGVCVCVCVCVCMNMFMSACESIGMCLCECVSVCVFVCLCVCVSVFIAHRMGVCKRQKRREIGRAHV